MLFTWRVSPIQPYVKKGKKKKDGRQVRFKWEGSRLKYATTPYKTTSWKRQKEHDHH